MLPVRVKHVRLPKYRHQPIASPTLMWCTGASAQRLPVKIGTFIFSQAVCSEVMTLKRNFLIWNQRSNYSLLNSGLCFSDLLCLFSPCLLTICLKYCYPQLFFSLFVSFQAIMFLFFEKRFKKTAPDPLLTPPPSPGPPQCGLSISGFLSGCQCRRLVCRCE